MVDWIMAFVNICNTALAAGKTLKKWKGSDLSEREKDVLKAAANAGEIQLMECDCLRVVYAGNREFCDDHDAAVAAYYLDAFTQLCHRGLIVSHGEPVFRLTGQGFDIARALEKKK